MAVGPGFRSFLEIAYALARPPGRLEIDFDEASRYLDDIADRYERGYFADDEVMVMVAPGEFQPLRKVLEDARRRGEIGPSLGEIRICGYLTDAAAKRLIRLLQASGLSSATRILTEWSELDASDRRPSKARGKPGPQPKLRESIIARMLDHLRSGHRTPGELKSDTLAVLATEYGGSPNTAGAARDEALKRFAEFHKSNSEK
jgi:hypothetical protein